MFTGLEEKNARQYVDRGEDNREGENLNKCAGRGRVQRVPETRKGALDVPLLGSSRKKRAIPCSGVLIIGKGERKPMQAQVGGRSAGPIIKSLGDIDGGRVVGVEEKEAREGAE